MKLFRELVNPHRHVTSLIQEVICSTGCQTGLDIGCGTFSNLTALRPTLTSTGIDTHQKAIQSAQQRQLHDEYIQADIMHHDFTGRKFDVVIANEVIEHLDKRAGWDLLWLMESLASKLVIVTTPNGFLPQGPEFNNPCQSHISGWFVHDFESLGYSVQGILGPKFMRGYAGELKWRGARILNPFSEILGYALAPWPFMHFGLLAIKNFAKISPRLEPSD